MHYVTVGLCAAVLLSGCGTDHGQESLLSSYAKHKTYHKHLLKTEKVQFSDESGQTRMVVTATYLAVPEKARYDKKPERFIVGLYSDSEEALTPSSLDLMLDGTKPLKVKPLREEEVRVEQISFVTPWKHFYLVTFPYTQKEQFTLTVRSRMYGKGLLRFAKRAKYTFTKKAF